MKVVDLPAKDGLRWVSDAFAMFRTQPMGWISLIAIWAVMWLVALLIPPILGLMMLLGPTLVGGMMLACRDQQAGQPVVARHLFAAFSASARPLLNLGAILLLIETVIALSLGAMGLPQQPARAANGLPDLVAMRAMFADKVGIIALGVFLSCVVKAIFWFAVPLIALRNMSVTHAIRWSAYACLANVAPILVFGVVMFGLNIVAVLPMLLGLLVLIPVFVIANYTSYLRAFSDEV